MLGNTYLIPILLAHPLMILPLAELCPSLRPVNQLFTLLANIRGAHSQH